MTFLLNSKSKLTYTRWQEYNITSHVINFSWQPLSFSNSMNFLYFSSNRNTFAVHHFAAKASKAQIIMFWENSCTRSFIMQHSSVQFAASASDHFQSNFFLWSFVYINLLHHTSYFCKARVPTTDIWRTHFDYQSQHLKSWLTSMPKTKPTFSRRFFLQMPYSLAIVVDPPTLDIVQHAGYRFQSSYALRAHLLIFHYSSYLHNSLHLSQQPNISGCELRRRIELEPMRYHIHKFRKQLQKRGSYRA